VGFVEPCVAQVLTEAAALSPTLLARTAHPVPASEQLRHESEGPFWVDHGLPAVEEAAVQFAIPSAVSLISNVVDERPVLPQAAGRVRARRSACRRRRHSSVELDRQQPVL